ncbi:MAG: hypothetical protein ACJAWV_003152 [Flammeovirgaceae bacterium]|jgi:hypothetical protein
MLFPLVSFWARLALKTNCDNGALYLISFTNRDYGYDFIIFYEV